MDKRQQKHLKHSWTIVEDFLQVLEFSLEGGRGARSNGGLPEALVCPDPAKTGRKEDATKLQAIATPHRQRAAIPVSWDRHCLRSGSASSQSDCCDAPATVALFSDVIFRVFCQYLAPIIAASKKFSC